MIPTEDRVQWHRAWAETLRWLEEFEVKHLEFIRCIRYFDSMSDIWNTLARNEPRSGYRAFAYRQTSTFKDLKKDADTRFRAVGYGPFVRDDGRGFIKAVEELRVSELSWLTEMVKPKE